jgi:predicted nucleic acid-binding protein
VNYVLDTCVISELVKKKPEPAVVEWVRQQHEDTLYLGALSLGEIQKGIVKVADPKRRATLQEWLDKDLAERFAGRILDVSPEVALTWGRLQGEAEKRGRRMAVIDGLIAAVALCFGAAVVTRNVEHFEPSGVALVNPWPEGKSSP